MGKRGSTVRMSKLHLFKRKNGTLRRTTDSEKAPVSALSEHKKLGGGRSEEGRIALAFSSPRGRKGRKKGAHPRKAAA